MVCTCVGPLENGDRRLYFHSLASTREGSVSTSVIRNESLFEEDVDSSWNLFTISESARISQSASEDASDSGILFFGLLSEMSLACWNSRTTYSARNIHVTYKVRGRHISIPIPPPSPLLIICFVCLLFRIMKRFSFQAE